MILREFWSKQAMVSSRKRLFHKIRTFVMLSGLVFAMALSGLNLSSAALAACVTSPKISAHTATAISPSGLSENLSPNIGQIGALAPDPGKPSWDGADRANDVKVLPNNLAVVAGKFTSYDWGGQSYVRNNLVIINTQTGEPTSIAPNINGELFTVELSCDGKSVYVGGNFNRVDGQVRNNAAQINIADGALMPWNPNVDGSVQDIARIQRKVIIGGTFTTVGGQKKSVLASVNATTGALTGWMNVRVTGADPGGPKMVFNVVPSPDEKLMVITGNFYKANGKSHPRMFVLGYNGTHPTLKKWYTPRTENPCSPKKDHEELGVAFAPGSKAFYTVSTGGYSGNQNPAHDCDAAVKWPLSKAALGSTKVKPLWINWNHGDSLSGVVATEKSVFIAGHNKYCKDKAGRGGTLLDRPGICELDAKTGAATQWHGTTSRQRSMHVRMALTPQGLIYVGDANKLNNQTGHNDLGLWLWAN
ncbi:delta-60 repeat domain-containing protein [Candidatus Saccharibacteria bacterium]|nr:delta-60 repeat domain-containing protein [Candidatus Saccharibacteria bacterium]